MVVRGVVPLLVVVFAGCSGRVAGDGPGTDGGSGGSGGSRASGEPTAMGGTTSKGGGTAIGGTTSKGGGTATTGGATSKGGGTATTGGTTSKGGGTATGGTTSGNGGASVVDGGVCSYGTYSAPSTGILLEVARVDLSTIYGLGAPFMGHFSAAQLLEGYECSPAQAGDTAPLYFGKFYLVGCGNETVGTNGGFGGPTETFSLSTGRHVGATLSSDVPFGPCASFHYVAGQNYLDCPNITRYACRRPEDAGPELGCTDATLKLLLQLRGRPECDCSGDPGVDACFGPGTCECWCSKFVPAARACSNWTSTG